MLSGHIRAKNLIKEKTDTHVFVHDCQLNDDIIIVIIISHFILHLLFTFL